MVVVNGNVHANPWQAIFDDSHAGMRDKLWNRVQDHDNFDFAYVAVFNCTLEGIA